MSGSSRPRSTASQSGAARRNPEKPIPTALRRYAWFVLAYTVLVVVWGTIVRATGSGGGCGDHWPLCNGVVLPQLARFHTIVEFTHRAMSGISLALIAILQIGTWRATRRGHFARWASGAAMILVLNEALLGALLVLLQLVGHNASQARSIYLSLHFANTLLLLAALALAAEFLSRPRIRGTTALRHGKLHFPALGILATLFVGVSGSLAALGDTLFPSLSLSSAFHQDFSSSGSLLLRLRWLHPASAVIAGLFIAWLLVEAFRRSGTPRMRALGIVVLCSLFAQYVLGAADVLLLAPVWLQALHLLNGDILWITFILLTASYCLVEKPARERLTGESGKFAEPETIAAEAAASLNA
jgi:cytochrome c oxidase assembly protein subunit 15